MKKTGTTAFISKTDRSSASRKRNISIGLGLAMALATTACGSIVGSGQATDGNPGQPMSAVQETSQRTTEASGSQFAAALPIEPEIVLAEDVGFTPTAETTVTVNPDGTTSIVGPVEVPTAGGAVPIIDADLILEEDPTTGETVIVGGSGQVPFPTLGALADATINHLPEGIIGTAEGRELHHLGAHLVDDRRYLYFHFDGGLDVDLPIANTPGYEALPETIQVPVGVSATMVLDPTDPYFYIGGACPSDPNDKDEDKDRDTDQNGDKDSNRDQSSSSTTTPDSSLPENPLGEAYTIDAANLPPGEDCGFGFSLQGNIPAPATAGGTTFSGHVVLDGVVPLYTGVELDGSAVLAIDQGVRTVGWGTVLATLPLVPDWVNIRIPVGNGSVDVQADGARIGMAIEGTMDGGEQIMLPLDIPIELPSNAASTFVASYGFLVGADGTLTIDPASRVEIGGEMGLGLSNFGDVVGLDMEDLLASQSVLRLDTTGARLTGTMKAQIHPVLETDATTTFDALLSLEDPAESFLAYEADLRIAGTELAEAKINLNRDGLFVTGMVGTDGLLVEVTGEVSDSGANLSGRTATEIPLDGVDELADRTSAALTKAIADVERLDNDINNMRETVRAERRERDRAFVEARSVLEVAKRDLDTIDNNIATNNRKIADLRAERQAEKDRFARLNLGQQALQLVSHNATLTGLDAEIAALTTASETQRLLRPAAQATFTGAQQALAAIERALDAIPVDTDPRVVTLISSRETAVAALSVARDGADLVDVGGTIRGEIIVTVGTSGFGGSFIGELCRADGSNCETLSGGRVELAPHPALCLELFGLDELCLKI